MIILKIHTTAPFSYLRQQCIYLGKRIIILIQFAVILAEIVARN